MRIPLPTWRLATLPRRARHAALRQTAGEPLAENNILKSDLQPLEPHVCTPPSPAACAIGPGEASASGPRSPP
jgi:hypothetical protein